MSDDPRVSIILPCLNEAENLTLMLPRLMAMYPTYEIIVVDDGSKDNSVTIASQAGAKVIIHPRRMGNGAAIKTGARNASGEIIVFMDADGQHDPADVQRLIAKIIEGYDMAVGARTITSQASLARYLANLAYNKLASLMTGFDIHDLTSGFRAVRSRQFRKFLYLMPNGFSYPTTSTMAFFRSAFPVAYIHINASTRKGKSKIKWFKDGTRFFLIILKIGALFSPMRFFLPISLFFFITACSFYTYTYLFFSRFTNMSALLFITSILTFLIGIVSEQISSLHYKHSEDADDFKS